MDPITIIVACFIGIIIGIVFTWLIFRSRSMILVDRLDQTTKGLEDESQNRKLKEAAVHELTTKVTQLEMMLEHEKKAADEKIQLLNKGTEELRTTFKALSSDALKNNSESFLDLAKTVF